MANDAVKIDKGDVFTCAGCGGEFIAGRTNEEAEEERKQLFAGFEEEDCGIVCDDCFKEMDKEYGWTKQ